MAKRIPLNERIFLSKTKKSDIATRLNQLCDRFNLSHNMGELFLEEIKRSSEDFEAKEIAIILKLIIRGKYSDN